MFKRVFDGVTKRRYGIVLQIALLFVVLLVTNPQHLPLVVLVVPFVLLYSIIYSIYTQITAHYGKSGEKNGVKVSQTRVMAHIVAGFPTVLLAFSSIKQLSIRDVFLLTTLVLGVIFYMKRVRFGRSN